MTKQELIDHLQHLEQYTHYSEDAPALREVIEMLTETHDKRTETHACDFENLPSAQLAQQLDQKLAQPDLDEWCVDCKEYDQERHSCPRWNRVIRQTLKDAQPEQRWIPCSERLPEEKDAGILKKLGTSKWSDYVLATVEVRNERMTVTACTYDGVWDWNMKYAFPDYEIVAWMPLPEIYRGDEDGE